MALNNVNDYLIPQEQAFATAGALTNNLILTSSTLNVTPTTNNDAISGVFPPSLLSGGLLIIANAHASNLLVLNANDANSAAANRFQFAEGGTGVVLKPGQTATFSYVNGSGWRYHRPAPLTATGLGTEQRVFKQDITITVGLITALTGITVNKTVTGLLVGDAVQLNALQSLSGGIVANQWVSAPDTLSVNFVTAIALGLTLGTINFRLLIARS